MVTVSTHTHATPHTLTRSRWRDIVRAVADLIHAGADRRAWDDGLTVSRVGLTGRSYRSPLFDQRAVRREG